VDSRASATPPVTIENSTFDNNTAYYDGGGAVYLNCAQDVLVSGSVFTNNFSGGEGGGLDIEVGDGNVGLVLDSTFSGNTAGQGGGVYFENGYGVVRNTTIDHNSAARGGGLCGDTPVTVEQSTITANTAELYGGGMQWRQGSFGSTFTNFTIVMSTVSGNTATSGNGNELAIDRINSNAQFSEITGSIIAGTAEGSSVFGTGTNSLADFPVNVSYSAVGTEDSSGIVDMGHNLLDLADPELEALADNGGPTRTMLPMAGSPVIGAGPATVPVYPDNDFDQRGEPYVRVYEGTLDMGAVEGQPGPSPTTSTSVAPTTTRNDEPVTPAFTG